MVRLGDIAHISMDHEDYRTKVFDGPSQGVDLEIKENLKVIMISWNILKQFLIGNFH